MYDELPDVPDTNLCCYEENLLLSLAAQFQFFVNADTCYSDILWDFVYNIHVFLGSCTLRTIIDFMAGCKYSYLGTAVSNLVVNLYNHNSSHRRGRDAVDLKLTIKR